MKKRLFWLIIFTIFATLSACSVSSEPMTSTTIFSSESTSTTQITNTITSTSVVSSITEATSTIVTTQPVSTLTSAPLSTTISMTIPETTIVPTTIPETTIAPTTIPTTMVTTTFVTLSTHSVEIIEIFAMNDFHGGAYANIASISSVGQHLIDAQAENPYALVIASGDMLQGTALSNEYRGRPVIEAMNHIGFDAYTIGNHEFDWGIVNIQNYYDDNPENGEAEYPMLAANVVESVTGDLLDWTQPYVIYDLYGIRIGIIGVIGEDTYGSISPSMVSGLTFLNAETTLWNYAQILREEELCDIVIASIHYYDIEMNKAISDFSGSHRIDAIFNAHTHTSVADTPGDSYGRTDIDIPYAQASSYNYSLFTKITLTFDRASHSITSGSAKIYQSDDLGESNFVIDQLLDDYASVPEYIEKMGEVLASSAASYTKYALAPWGASVIRDYAGVDVGVLNTGGFRVTMYSGPVTMGELVEIYPFDNEIKSSLLSGQELTTLYQEENGYLVFDDRISYSDGKLRLDGVPVVLSTLYRVGAVDFIFDNDDFSFLDGDDIQNTHLLMRDLLAEDLRNTSGVFNPANGTSVPPVA